MAGALGTAVTTGHSAAQTTISVVIPFRNALRDLPTIASALERQTLDRRAFEVIWIDDGSTDGSKLWLQERLTPGWTLLVHPEPRGSYAARNSGLRAAVSENLAFTDADCRPDEDWLEQGLTALASALRVAGRIHLDISSAPSVAELVDAGRFLRQHRYVEEGFAATANLFVRRSVFDLVGNFDERLQSGGDHEFGWRCSQAGISIEYAEHAVVHHPARASLGQLLRKAERVGFGAGQVLRRRRMPIRNLAKSAYDRLALVRRRGAGERTPRIDGLRRSFFVTAVYMLVTVATGLGCLRGLLRSGAAASPDRNDCRQNSAA